MLLKTEDLVKIYGKRRVVNGVSFEVNEGEIVGLLGRNGAGKTTTFKMTVGLISPSEGQIWLKGNDITDLPIYRRARCGLGYLPQESSVFRELTVEDNLMAIMETLKGDKSKYSERANKILEEYGLLKLAKQKARTLSGGEMRRLEISRALITSPAIILLDEPFSGVDPIAVSEIQDIVRKLKSQNIGVLLTDHNVRETLAVTDRSYIIDEGYILCNGTPKDIMCNPLARKHYLGEKFTL
ncbi:MAG: LPS export ABC transporter ATP-binding protein [Planctomycetes bacterium]|nr:LPS export ABC transporter ATP-binding protein [Planctomycetota bacterium]